MAGQKKLGNMGVMEFFFYEIQLRLVRAAHIIKEYFFTTLFQKVDLKGLNGKIYIYIYSFISTWLQYEK